jgi:glycosyltransferase involved in cell wall biosynthesis
MRSDEMHLTFIIPYTPTPIRVRPYNFIKSLSRRGHSITLFTLVQSANELPSLQELRDLGVAVTAYPLTRFASLKNILLTLPTQLPLQADFCWQPELARAILRHVSTQPCDIMHIEHLRGAQYGVWVQRKIPQLTVPIIWDSVDCITYLFEQASRFSQSILNRLLTRFELPRTRRYESSLIQQFSRVLVTSEIDKLQLLRNSQRADDSDRITVVANGVDTQTFQPAGPRDAATVVFSGKMSYHANNSAALYLAREIMPRVWRVYPEARLLLVGSRPSRQVRSLASDSRIVVTGYVADMSTYLQRARISVAPLLYGAGIQNKVLEAMACATPVVATPQAIAALDVKNGKEILIGESPDAFATQVCALLGDNTLCQVIGNAGRSYVQKRHCWDNIGSKLEAIYSSAKQHS